MIFFRLTLSRLILCLLVLLLQSCQAQKVARLTYPITKSTPKTHTYHQDKITDSFHNLTDATSEETKTWAKAQDGLFKNYVQSYPQYEALKGKVSALIQFTGRSELPVTVGKNRFYLKDNEKGAWDLYHQIGNQPAKGLFGEKPPFNPRAIYFFIPSPNGQYIALGLATGYFDWKILEVATGKLSDHTLKGVGMGQTRLTWTKDSQSFFYTSFDKTDDQGKRSGLAIKQHHLNADNKEDHTVFIPPSDGAKIELAVCNGGENLFLTERAGAAINAKVYYKKLTITNSEVQPLMTDIEASLVYMGNNGQQFFFETDYQAPKGKVISVNLDNPNPENWRTVIPEGKDAIMGYQSAGGTFLPLVAGKKLVLPIQKRLVQYLHVYDFNGKKTKEIQLPSGGLFFNTNGLNALSGNFDSSQVLTRFIGITEPNTIFNIDVNSGKVTAFSRAKTSFNANDYTSEIVFCQSKDGTQIPISLTYKKGIKRNGQNPLLLQVYGAIAFTNFPYFQGDYISWLDMGGIHAVAHIRGGGAFGAGWHQAGIKQKKQNGIDDYIAAIEYVIDQKYTSAKKTVLNGVSAGTIPVGAVVTQRPDLVGAAVLHYGMLDMIGYAERFGSDANHAYMIPDLGNTANVEDYKALKGYSPYQKLAKNTCYPPILALTSEKDTPLDTDSYRFIAALQNGNTNCSAPYLLQMAWGSGHSGFGSPEQSSALTFTDEMAYLIKALAIDTKDWLRD